ARLHDEAERTAKRIRDAFIFKNLKKLSSIVEKKGDFESAAEIEGTVRLTGLSGTLIVKFKDGAQFTAQNSIVWSRSIHGTEFPRFPLTFHDVILSSGERMPRPSEERMNVVFAGSAPQDAIEIARAAAEEYLQLKGGIHDGF